MTDTFNKILTKISNGEKISQYELLPFLLSEKKELRLKINVMLAFAFFQSRAKENIKQAAVFINRAWNLSGFDDEILPLFERIHYSLDQIEEVKKAYKRLFIKNVDLKNYDIAGKYFDLWQNAYPIHKHLDKYDYDYDIINCMTKLAEPFVLPKQIKKNEPDETRKRLAYFITGMSEVNSVLIKIDLLFSKYHNKEMYKIVFFTLNNEEEVIGSQQGKYYLNLLHNNNVEVLFADKKEEKLEKIISLAKKIHNYEPDLIIVDVALRNFDNYFLTLVLSKIKILCFNQGPPAQFIPPHVNWNIAWTKHPLIDSPVNGSLVPLEFELFDGNEIQEFRKNELGIPNDSFVIVCAGRTQKFQNIDFWNVIRKILTQNTNVYFLAIGIEEYYAPDLSSLVDSETKQRIKFFGWQNNYLKLLKSADLVLDTYPSGGGVVLIDAMVLEIPILFFSNNYLHEYDQTDWSPAEELVNVPELTVPRGNFDEFLIRANNLIRNEELRKQLGKKCRKNIDLLKGKPLRMIQRCEKIYDSIIADKINDSEDICNELNMSNSEIMNQMLIFENYYEWQNAYANGYNSNMGNHAVNFYNKNLAGLGLYDLLNKANSIIEYGPSHASFMKNIIEQYPDKNFYLAEYYTGLVEQLRNNFSGHKNVEVLLNHPEISSLSNIDLSFSFLLSQSMPKILWKNHLKNVKTMLSKSGCYIFQFAYHPDGYADDQVQNGIYGNNKYKPEEIYKMLEEAGYSGCDLSVPVTLERLNSDIIWYFCRAY